MVDALMIALCVAAVGSVFVLLFAYIPTILVWLLVDYWRGGGR